MHTFIALLRAVNVGGTGKLPMADLKAMAEAAGFRDVRTYIASGNVIFRTALGADSVKQALEARLLHYAGKAVGVVVRTIAEMEAVIKENPFKAMPGNQVTAIFLDAPAASTALEDITGCSKDERVALGQREIFVFYAAGQAATKLRIPAARCGTARNMNTVVKLAELAAGGPPLDTARGI
jgi:uncharacterized protein (DUF1697 family)